MPEKRIETGFPKVPVICESVDDVQPSHHGERNLVNDSRLSGLASSICLPCGLAVGFSRLDQLAIGAQLLAQLHHVGSEGSSRGGVSALEQNKARCIEIRPCCDQRSEYGSGGWVPLVAHIPNRQHSDRVKQHLVHG